MASWSPLAKVSDYISGKVDHGKVYCACGKEARHFTVRKEGPTKGKVFYKCPADECKLFVWGDHIEHYDASGHRMSQPSMGSTQKAAQSPAPSPSPSPAAPAPPVRSQSGVKGRSTITSTPTKRKTPTAARNLQDEEEDSVTESEEDEAGLGSTGRSTAFGSPTKRNRSAAASTTARAKRVIPDDEEEEDLIMDLPPSPSLTPHKSLANFGAKGNAPSTPQNKSTPSAAVGTHNPGATPISGALDALKLDMEHSLSNFEKECARQTRLMNAANQKAEAKDRLLAKAHSEIAELRSRVHILEKENAALRNSK